jgi:hypothetical protein
MRFPNAISLHLCPSQQLQISIPLVQFELIIALLLLLLATSIFTILITQVERHFHFLYSMIYFAPPTLSPDFAFELSSFLL